MIIIGIIINVGILIITVYDLIYITMKKKKMNTKKTGKKWSWKKRSLRKNTINLNELLTV